MISWQDEAVLLSARPHGETAVIAQVFTPAQGRHAGVIRGGAGRKLAPLLQPGGQLAVVWSARLAEHLGSFTVEPLRSRAVAAMADRLSLAGVNAVCGLLAQVLPEREPHPALYARTIQLLDLLGQPDLWPLAYLRWEQALLEELGFGLDLSVCAVTGQADDLAYVSPRSGRAVSRAGAGDWAVRLLPLPPVLAGQGEAGHADIHQALETTGYFITHRLVAGLGERPVTPARQRFLDVLARGRD